MGRPLGIILLVVSAIFFVAGYALYEAGAPGRPTAPTSSEPSSIQILLPSDAGAMNFKVRYNQTLGPNPQLTIESADNYQQKRLELARAVDDGAIDQLVNRRVPTREAQVQISTESGKLYSDLNQAISNDPQSYTSWDEVKLYRPDLAVRVDRMLLLDTQADEAQSQYIDAAKKISESQSQENLRLAAVFRLTGTARVDPSSITLQSSSSNLGDRVSLLPGLSGSTAQYIGVELHAGEADGYTRNEAFAGVSRGFSLSAALRTTLASVDNARTAVKLPGTSPPRACNVPAGGQFLAELQNIGTIPDCYGSTNGARTAVEIPTASAIRIDYSNAPTSSTGALEWNIDTPTESIDSSYVDLAEEASDGRRFALSATAIGLGSALAPLGLERLSRARKTRRQVKPGGRRLGTKKRRLRPRVQSS